MASFDELIDLYTEEYLPAYSDLVAYLADKPAGMLLDSEATFSHVMVYFTSRSKRPQSSGWGGMRDKSIQPAFRPEGAIVYDSRILSFVGLEAVSLMTLEGRIKVPMILGAHQKARIDQIRGQADLVYRNGTFYLYATLEVPEGDPIESDGFFGVDLGIVNIAVDSDGTVYSGAAVTSIHKKHGALRAALQRAGTRSAKRHLKRLSGKTARLCRDVNHCISKSIVTKAKGTDRSVALEDLTGIRKRKRKTVSKAQRGRLNSWGFHQLRRFIEYKAQLDGVTVVIVASPYTSQTCPNCGYVHASNRPDRDSFLCGSCGFAGPSDHIAAMNIAARAAVNQPIVARL
jgi:putative transposase